MSWEPDLPAPFERSPFFATIADAASRLSPRTSFPTPEEIDVALASRSGVRFVRQPPRPRRARRTPDDPRQMYDARIAAGEVPTRASSWHDLMNALVWATFPVAKRALHARQHRLVTPGAPHRTRTLDALALVDEGSVVVESAVALHDEREIQDALRAGDASLAVFGHAIYEGLALGWPMPIASVVVVSPVPSPGRGEDLDASIAAAIERLADPRELLRLPLQGLDRMGSATRVRAPRGPSGAFVAPNS